MKQLLVLESKRFARLHGASHVHVAAGSLWLTIDRQPDDLVLECGQGVDLPAGAHALLQALDGEPLRLCVQRPDPWWRRLADAATSTAAGVLEAR
jgi:hypothetical protein